MKAEKGRISRRDFLAATAAGIVGAGLGAGPPGRARAGARADETTGENAAAPITRTLGRTGIEVPVVSMGVMNANNPELIAASFDLGIRHFDTAANYQGGRNEEMVGSVIAGRGIRERVIVGTKIYRPDTRRGDGPADTRRKMLAEVDESLERLQMEYVDILYVHVVDSAELVRSDAVHAALEEIRAGGKARFTGVATHRNMAEVIGAVAETGRFDVVLAAINVTMADDAELLGAIEKAAAAGIGIIAMKTQAGGRRFPLPEAAAEYDSSTINTTSLKWVLRHGAIATAIPGYTTFEHMRENFSVAYDLEYTERERRLLGDCDLKVGLGFCRQCGECAGTCPRGADIPSMMRAHMYASQYADFRQARSVYDGISRGRDLGACSACPSCAAVCAHAVDVARRIDELKLIYA